MATYNYTRELVDGAYNINNQYDIDGEGNQVYLWQEIVAEATLPDDFKIDGNAGSCDIIFTDALDGTQQTTLDTVVAAHKAHAAP